MTITEGPLSDALKRTVHAEKDSVGGAVVALETLRMPDASTPVAELCSEGENTLEAFMLTPPACSSAPGESVILTRAHRYCCTQVPRDHMLQGSYSYSKGIQLFTNDICVRTFMSTCLCIHSQGSPWYDMGRGSVMVVSMDPSVRPGDRVAKDVSALQASRAGKYRAAQLCAVP